MSSSNRPIIDLPASPFTWVLEGVTLVGVIVSFWLAISTWKSLPPIIPVHFGITGTPDSWGIKEVLWFFPVLNVIFYMVFALVSRHPHTFNYPVAITPENAAQQYYIGRQLLTWMKTELTWLFAFIEWQVIQVSLGGISRFNLLGILIFSTMIFITVGIALWQAYQAR